MYVYMCSMYICDIYGGQKREPDALKLELQTLVSCQVDVGTEPYFSGSTRSLNH